MNTKKLILIDGTGFMYRAYYASLGATYTTGLKLFIGMLKRVTAMLTDEGDYGVCAFDWNGKLSKVGIYPGYKAGRASMPESLKLQEEYMQRSAEALGWNVVRLHGIEADDIIGTLTMQGCRQGLRVVICSSDKDLAQLVNERVVVIDTMRDKVRDVVTVTKEFGIPPKWMTDYQSLIGDKVDDIPGIEGIGPVTAAKLINQYEGLDGLLANLDKVKGSAGVKLRASVEWINVARKLVTINTELPGVPVIDTLSLNHPSSEIVKTILNEYKERVKNEQSSNT